ncbi:Scr1 family TA system antitoxin-like transcriptional regulator [Streptomyces chrestomyceticus]|uniref:Scr1 family TA system antitoxin-like transcriptional regulator n=1 Tax=Streptomyces chrestomyceticus TaxID=68185 RepID=UPI0036BE8BCC
MSPTSSLPAPTGAPPVADVLIGLYVQALRTGRGWTQRDLALLLGRPPHWIADLERARRSATAEDLSTVLLRCGIADYNIVRGLQAWLMPSPEPHTLTDRAPGAEERLHHFEYSASAIRLCAPFQLPAFLRTPAYAQALENAACTGEEQVSSGRRLLPVCASLLVVLDETVLGRLAGSPAVKAEQIAYLQQVVDRDEVRLLVTPKNAMGLPEQLCELTLYDFDHPLYVVEQGHPVYLNGPPASGRSRHRLITNALEAAAGSDHSQHLLAKYLKRFRRQPTAGQGAARVPAPLSAAPRNR